MLLGLSQFARDFIRGGLDPEDEEYAADREVVKAVCDIGMDLKGRRQVVLHWLNRYHVFMGFPLAAREAVCAVVIEFADEHRALDRPSSATELMRRYCVLEERLKSAALVGRTSPKTREVVSLTSKALWCCYPEDTPLYDNYACRALQVLCRLADVKAKPGDQGFAAFVDIWFQFYEQLRPALDTADPAVHPYSVRVFDRLLWHLGQPNFEAPAEEGQAYLSG